MAWIHSLVMYFVLLFGGFLAVRWVFTSVNCWYYERKLGKKRANLPPGDLGWPFIGNMWSFLRAFKSSNPDSFISTFITRWSLHHTLSLGSRFLHLYFINIIMIMLQDWNQPTCFAILKNRHFRTNTSLCCREKKCYFWWCSLTRRHELIRERTAVVCKYSNLWKICRLFLSFSLFSCSQTYYQIY